VTTLQQKILIPDNCNVLLQMLKKDQKGCNPREIAQKIINAMPENDIIGKVCLFSLYLWSNSWTMCCMWDN